MSANLIELLYTSKTHLNIQDSELNNILRLARTKNSQHSITGLLTYDNATFIQLLEGEESEILKLFEQIKKDHRHYNVELLYTSIITERTFNQWSMAYNYINQQQSKRLIKKSLTNNAQNISKELFLLYLDENEN